MMGVKVCRISAVMESHDPAYLNELDKAFYIRLATLVRMIPVDKQKAYRPTRPVIQGAICLYLCRAISEPGFLQIGAMLCQQVTGK